MTRLDISSQEGCLGESLDKPCNFALYVLNRSLAMPSMRRMADIMARVVMLIALHRGAMKRMIKA